jgi:predicted glycoside hydrolase/deacetylase ChbG (UPF0249 family)
VRRYLIVNADDFNLTEGVTRGILYGNQHGIITSTTVMVNLPGLETSRDLARQAPGLGLGLHVNLTLGAPVLAAGAVPSLVDADGHFVRDRERVGEVGVLAEIRDEAAAQARRFEEVFGHRPTHIDTHYHMHRLPRVLDAVLDVGSDLGLPVRAVTPEMAVDIRRRGLPAPDRMVGDVGPDAYWTPENLIALMTTAEGGVTELMCHPGYADGALSISTYREQREGELRALCDPRVRAALTAAGIRLIHYKELAALSGQRA